MDKLSTDFIMASPSRFNWSAVEDLYKFIKYPDPSEEDLCRGGCSPSILLSAGEGVPVDPSEARTYSINRFKTSPGYKEWQKKFIPTMTVFWPCVPSEDVQELANSLHSLGLNCVYISGQVGEITTISGFALTKGGMDLSDHLAAAYICAGHIPPLPIVERALSSKKEKILENKLIECVNDVVEHLDGVGARLNDFIVPSISFRR